EPVQACPPSATYRLRKVVRRNRAAAVALAVVALLLVGIAAGSLLAAAYYQKQEQVQRGAAPEESHMGREKEGERALAVIARNKAEAAEGLAEERGRELLRNLYIAEMNLAGQAAQQENGTWRARQLLAPWRTRQPDLRGWEWYYLNGFC